MVVPAQRRRRLLLPVPDTMPVQLATVRLLPGCVATGADAGQIRVTQPVLSYHPPAVSCEYSIDDLLGTWHWIEVRRQAQVSLMVRGEATGACPQATTSEGAYTISSLASTAVPLLAADPDPDLGPGAGVGPGGDGAATHQPGAVPGLVCLSASPSHVAEAGVAAAP